MTAVTAEQEIITRAWAVYDAATYAGLSAGTVEGLLGVLEFWSDLEKGVGVPLRL